MPRPPTEPGVSLAESAARAADLELIVAVSENDVIGRANQLPWHLSGDLRRFKALTLGQCILMGRKTHESIGRALPDRTNLILTRSRAFHADGCHLVGTVDEARRIARPKGLLMVIGGAQIYRECLPFANRIQLTLVHTRVADGDTFFADWRAPGWTETARERHEADERNSFAYSFVTLERKSF